MIIDKIECVGRYTASVKNLAAALAFLAEAGTLADGRHEFNGGFIMVSSGETTAFTSKNFEAHKKYADVMFLVEGNEEISFCNTTELNLVKEYDSASDIAFYDGEGCAVKVTAGMFYVFLPEEAHKPGSHTNTPTKYRKYVLKCEQ